MKAKFIIPFIGLIFQAGVTYSQGKISVSTFGADTFIETYSISSYGGNEFILEKAYRIGPRELLTLKQGSKKALEWIKLNEVYQKSFEKEICRFEVMGKEDYKFHGYINQLSSEMILLFKGFDDGSFELIIKPYNSFETFIEFNHEEMAQKFDNLLNGKSANKEIDDIFN